MECVCRRVWSWTERMHVSRRGAQVSAWIILLKNGSRKNTTDYTALTNTTQKNYHFFLTEPVSIWKWAEHGRLLAKSFAGYVKHFGSKVFEAKSTGKNRSYYATTAAGTWNVIESHFWPSTLVAKNTRRMWNVRRSLEQKCRRKLHLRSRMHQNRKRLVKSSTMTCATCALAQTFRSISCQTKQLRTSWKCIPHFTLHVRQLSDWTTYHRSITKPWRQSKALCETNVYGSLLMRRLTEKSDRLSTFW